jgi:hypothetical protein
MRQGRRRSGNIKRKMQKKKEKTLRNYAELSMRSIEPQ